MSMFVGTRKECWAVVFTVVVFALAAPDLAGASITHTAASCMQPDVKAAYDLTVSGDTLAIPAGSCNWGTSAILVTKRITIRGAGIDLTTLTGSTNPESGGYRGVLYINTDGVRITGLTFNCVGVSLDMDNWRVDHNKFTCTTFNTGVSVRGARRTDSPKGLVDNNTFVNRRVHVIGFAAQGLTELNGSTQWADPLALGTDEAVYVENNTFTFTVFGNAIDCEMSGRYVARYNTLVDVIFEAHSIQSTIRACRKWEIYHNTIMQKTRDVFSAAFLRGGTGVVFNNTMTGLFSSPNIVVDNVRSFKAVGSYGMCDGSSLWDGNADSTGWPCLDQIGRGGDTIAAFDGTPPPYPAQISVPAYFWGNTVNGKLVGVSVGNGAGIHIKADRDYFVNKGQKPGYIPYVYPHPLTTGLKPPNGFRIVP